MNSFYLKIKMQREECLLYEEEETTRFQNINKKKKKKGRIKSL